MKKKNLQSIILFLLSIIFLYSCNGVGTAEFSEVAQVTPPKQETSTEDNTNDSSFTGIDSVVSPISANSITATINWTHDSSFATYLIFSVSNGTPTLITSVNAPTASYTINSLTHGSTYTYRVRAIDSEGKIDTNTNDVSVTTGPCPIGYIQVPGNSGLGVSDFCVMQFEAKNDGAGNPTSQASGSPWVSINLTNAKNECTSLGANYDLISNPEWMAIARNVESVAANWTGGAVGSGCLFRGNVGGANNCTGGASGYNASGPDSGTSRSDNGTASLTLTNGREIWDLSGNVWEWVDWTLGGGLGSTPSCASGAREFPAVNCGPLSSNDYLPENPSGQTPANYDSSFGLGRFIGGSGGTVRRGGHWAVGGLAGAFTLNIGNSSGYNSSILGFRCVYRP